MAMTVTALIMGPYHRHFRLSVDILWSYEFGVRIGPVCVISRRAGLTL